VAEKVGVSFEPNRPPADSPTLAER
jgi:hypothetical protein